MKSSEFPLDKADRRLSEVARRSEHSPTVYRYVESPSPENALAGNYDSLLDYWQVLFRHRVTLLKFTLGGLLAAVLISLVQTPIYRVRTSLEIQSTNFLEMKGSNDSAGSYASPESYVETQVKLLQSESLLEDEIATLKLHKERPTTGGEASAAGVHRIFHFSKTPLLPQMKDVFLHIE